MSRSVWIEQTRLAYCTGTYRQASKCSMLLFPFLNRGLDPTIGYKVGAGQSSIGHWTALMAPVKPLLNCFPVISPPISSHNRVLHDVLQKAC